MDKDIINNIRLVRNIVKYSGVNNMDICDLKYSLKLAIKFINMNYSKLLDKSEEKIEEKLE